MNGEPTANARTRNKKKDDAIRKKVEQEITKRTQKKNPHTPSNDKAKRHTVSSLRPATAIIIVDTAKIIQACQLMAAKRTDAVLVVDENGALVGILTDKDIAYRVVAEGLDVRMTRDPTILRRTTGKISTYCAFVQS